MAAGFRYSYDFDNNGTFEVGNGTYAGGSASATATVPASFLDDGPSVRVARLRITDKDNGSTDFLTSITVNNVAPTGGVTGDTFGVPGLPRHFTLSATDPSTADTAAGFTFT